MPRFSTASKEKLSTCHRDLQLLFNEVIRYYDCTIVCGHRSKKEQDAAFAANNSQLQWPNSKHNSMPSMAVDAAPFEQEKIDWSKTQSAFFAGFVKAVYTMLYDQMLVTHKLRLGIDWDSDNDVDDTKFRDACHFELIN